MQQELTRLEETRLGDDSVDQMILLAERLRESAGGEIDESAIQAVAEATGAPVEYVRLAVKLRSEKKKQSFLGNVRSQFLTLEPHTRRYVLAGLLASGCALLGNIDERVEAATNRSSNGIFAMLALALAAAALYNVATTRDSRQAAFSGAIFGAGFYLMNSVFGVVLGLVHRNDPLVIVPAALLGAVIGVGAQKVVDRNREKLGLRDPVRERQDLLRQLHQLREKLNASEQRLAFVSVDIVGSTRIKQFADPLAVEYTFHEYHHFVERVTERHGGRVHSTAGDGVICAFETAAQAFAAAKNLQTEILELNTFRNKLGSPIVLRCGVHSGKVMAPDAGDVTTVSFADAIDVASHFQKVAPPGGIAISELTASELPGGPASVGTTRVETVNNIRGVVWTPKTSLLSPSISNNPPLPGQA